MLDPETPCYIDATFHDWRTVKGRKQLQLIFEVPLEQQAEILTLLGPPDSVGSKWCMIALKNVNPAQAREEEPKGGDAHRLVSEPTNNTQPHASQSDDRGARPAEGGTSKPKRKFSELSLPEQCAIRCGDGRFQRFLEEQYGVTMPDGSPGASAQAADTWVKTRLHIQSKKELSSDTGAAYMWHRIEREFQQFLTDEEHGGSIRP